MENNIIKDKESNNRMNDELHAAKTLNKIACIAFDAISFYSTVDAHCELKEEEKQANDLIQLIYDIAVNNDVLRESPYAEGHAFSDFDAEELLK